MSDFDNSFDTVFKQFKDNTKPMCELMGCPELVEDFIVDVEINRQSFKSFYEAGQQSRQEEINNLVMSNHHLSMQLADSGNFYDYEKKRADELQNMVVKVLAELESIPYWDRSGNCETAIKLSKVAS